MKHKKTKLGIAVITASLLLGGIAGANASQEGLTDVGHSRTIGEGKGAVMRALTLDDALIGCQTLAAADVSTCLDNAIGAWCVESAQSAPNALCGVVFTGRSGVAAP